jgi:hypothetical protein
MRRLMIFGGALAMVVACTRAPEARNNPANNLASPAAAGGAAAVPTSGSAPIAPTTESVSPASTAPAAAQAYREITLPAGTVLPVSLETAVGSNISRVEQPVRARLRRAVRVNGVQVLPAGTIVNGHVTAAQRPGKVKGRGYVAMRFTQLDTPGEGTTKISSATISRLAPATKQKDTLQIVGPAAAGAVIGRIAGGKGAARKGAVIGGAAGTGYVLSTRGKDVRLGKGAPLSVRLTAPIRVRVASR